MPIDQLIAYFAQYIPLRDIEKNELRNRVVEKKLNAGNLSYRKMMFAILHFCCFGLF
jgi:hypothetical protein